jgi:succinyl-diaminopimelate desuccinylase
MQELTTAAKLLSDLIKCPSITPIEAGSLDVVEQFLTPLGFTCHRLKFDGDGSYPVDNLFATRGTKGRHLLFGGHVDVVPVGDEIQWTHHPFSAHIEDGVLWGRGATDMKSGVAAFCAAVKELVENGEADEGIISLAITMDEEADAINGTEKILLWAKEQGYKFDFSIVGEPSSGKMVGDRIKIGRRGSFDGLITVIGKQGHIAYPEKCKNPIPTIAAIASVITSKPLDAGDEHFQPSSLQISTIDVGNKATNIIPEKAILRFNVRHNDLWNQTNLFNHIKSQIDEIDSNGCEVIFESPTRGANCFIFPPANDVALLDEIIKNITGSNTKPEHSTTGGTSDARFIAQYCPVVECGLVGDHMHAVDERVPLKQVELLTNIYINFIERFFTK